MFRHFAKNVKKNQNQFFISSLKVSSKSHSSEFKQSGIHSALGIIGLASGITGFALAEQKENTKKLYPVILPNAKEREKIFLMHIKYRRFQMDLKQIGLFTENFSEFDMRKFAQEAIKNAVFRNSSVISIQDLDEAMELIRFGTTGLIDNNIETRRKIAIHEMGHALVGYLLGLEFYKVSVKSYWNIQGVFRINPKEEMTKDEILNTICVALAGHAAEELCGQSQVGSRQDLMWAKELASRVLHDERMEKAGSVINMDTEIEKILDTQMQRALSILKENNEIYLRLVDSLVEKNVLYREDFIKVIAKEKPESQPVFRPF